MTAREKIVRLGLVGILALASVGCEPKTKKLDEPSMPEWKEKESHEIIYSGSGVIAERKIYEESPYSYSYSLISGIPCPGMPPPLEGVFPEDKTSSILKIIIATSLAE